MNIFKYFSKKPVLSIEGKKVICQAMYARAKSFYLAAFLLHQKNGNQFVVLNLLCQSVELVLKSVLLKINYNYYYKKIKSNFGHNLEKLAEEVINNKKLKSLNASLKLELFELNKFYKNNFLRYAGALDLINYIDVIQYCNVMNMLWRVIKVIDRCNYFY